ncbi:MAG: hypothetical protein GX591_03600, partial [Planctomycetes bacterium]|nr:hypothetical protein [Planctomycetota bacterium]
RPGRPQVLLATGPPPQGAPLPATVTLGQAGAGRTLTSDRDTPPAIWVEGDRAVRVGALEAGTPHVLDDAALEPLDRLDGGGAEEGLSLLKWWARTSRTAEESRLVWLATLDGRTVLYVSDVRRAQ